MREFARGCMRTYLILAERARELDADPAFQEALAAAQVPRARAADRRRLQRRRPPRRCGREALDLDALAARGAGHERVDQLLVERLMGAGG